MNRTTLSSIFLGSWLLTSQLISPPVHAADAKVEKEAQDLQRDAIEDDFLYTRYGKAESKLSAAIVKCGLDKCSTALTATLYRDLGAMQIWAGSKEKGTASFREALKIDPNLGLSASYKTDELQALWDAARKSVASSRPPSDQPKGDFDHSASSELLVRTTIPLYVEYSGSEKMSIVKVSYRTASMTEFKSIELPKLGKGWGAYVPCNVVTEGVFRYYFEGFDDEGARVAGSGSRSKPFQSSVKNRIAGSPPALPNQSAPKQCPDLGECPPGMKGPACEDSIPAEKKAVGAACEANDECKSALCDPKENKCVAPKAAFNRFWLGLSASIDFVMVPSATNVCKVNDKGQPNEGQPINSVGYYCTNPDGSDFPTRLSTTENSSIYPNKGDEVKGGMAVGNFRIMASFDYALTPNWMLGLRAGYVANTYPGQVGPRPFPPLHLELRGSYLFGNDALIKGGFAPYLFAGAGVAETDAGVDVNVILVEDPPRAKSVKSWAMAGPGLVSAGAGVRYQFGSRFAILGAAKFTAALGGPAGFLPVLSPEVGMQVGF